MSRATSRSKKSAPGERFEWLETARPEGAKRDAGKGARAEPARRCGRCGWLDSVQEIECFRCGEAFPALDEEDTATGAIEAFTLPPTGPDGVVVTITPSRSLVAERRTNTEVETWYLRRRSADLGLMPDFDTLLALGQVNPDTFHRYAHQQAVARKALRDMGGAALLADETGLGKTIEAGLVAKELLLRGLVRTVLVVVPASLGRQWHEEMREKFNLDFQIVREHADLKDDPPLIIVSYALMRGQGVGALLRKRSVDLLICDEAHHLKNRATKQYKSVARVHKKFVLLLSATPFHNRLLELKNLLDILKPGLMGSTRAFNKQYVHEKDPRRPQNLHHLRALLGEVMIRNRRGEVAVKLPPRRAALYQRIELSPEEQAYYDELTTFISGEVRSRSASLLDVRAQPMSFVLSLINLQRELCSSPYAVVKGLTNLSNSEAIPYDVGDKLRDLAERGRALGPLWRKAKAVEEILEQFEGKLVVFCEFRATIAALLERLASHGISAIGFHGGLNPSQRQDALDTFRNEARVLVASRAGAEGLNIQFCATVLDFDLPWNPMVVEQRIGRVHRLGQTKEVTVFNLSVKGTIEARILDLLTHKLRLFTAVLGEVDLILGELHSDTSFSDLLRQAWLSGTVEGNLERALDRFGDQLTEARAKYESIKEAETVLDDIAPPPVAPQEGAPQEGAGS